MLKVLVDDGMWITAVIDGRWVQGKVYEEPSTSGIGNGRVSKLAVGKFDTYNHEMGMQMGGFHACMDYHYDRGLDFDDLRQPRLLRKIVESLEAHRLSSLDEGS